MRVFGYGTLKNVVSDDTDEIRSKNAVRTVTDFGVTILKVSIVRTIFFNYYDSMEQSRFLFTLQFFIL